MILRARDRLASRDSLMSRSPQRWRRPLLASGSTPCGQEPAEAAETLPDALERRRVREPKVPLRVGAEGRARGDGHVARLEELLGEPHRVRRQVSCVRQNVERARRLRADAEADGSQAGDHRAPPVVEDGAEATALVARLTRSEEHTSELQSPCNLVCRLLLEKKKK